MYYKDHRGTDFFVGALVGGAVAALTTLLFTTQKGKDVQQKVKDTFEDLSENVKEKVSAGKEKAEKLTDDAKEKVSALKEKAEESVSGHRSHRGTSDHGTDSKEDESDKKTAHHSTGHHSSDHKSRKDS